jgi:hypothetical protein
MLSGYTLTSVAGSLLAVKAITAAVPFSNCVTGLKLAGDGVGCEHGGKTVVVKFSEEKSPVAPPATIDAHDLQGMVGMAAGAEDREPAHQVVSRVTAYEKAIERYRHRHCGKAGVPSWAQVNGLRGETDTLEKGSAKLAYNFYL